MKGIRLIVLVLSVICTMHVDAVANGGGDQLQVERVSKLEIKPLSFSKKVILNHTTPLYAKRRKLSTTLRKPIVRKFKSKNHNLC